MPPRNTTKKRKIDQNVDTTYKEFRSKFALITKARANIWVVAAVVLFIFGLLSGTAILVDPNSVLSGDLKGLFGSAAFLKNTLTPSPYTYTGTIPGFTAPSSNLGQDNSGDSGGNTSCTRAPARVTASPTTIPSLANGQSITYSVTIQNRDSAACGPAAFVLSHGPTGGYSRKFNFYDYNFAHIIAPGQSATATIRVSPYDMPAVSNLSYLFTTHHSINTSTQSQYLDCNLIGNNTVGGGPETTTKLNTTGGAAVGERSVIVHSTGCRVDLSDAPPTDNPGGGNDDTGDTGGDDDGTGDTSGNFVRLTAAADPDDTYSESITVAESAPFGYRWESNMTSCRIDGEPGATLPASGDEVHGSIHPQTRFVMICSKQGAADVQDSVTINYGQAAAQSSYRASDPGNGGPSAAQAINDGIEAISRSIIDSLRAIGLIFR